MKEEIYLTVQGYLSEEEIRALLFRVAEHNCQEVEADFIFYTTNPLEATILASEWSESITLVDALRAMSVWS